MEYSRVLCYPLDLIYEEGHAVVFFTRCRVFKVGKIITYASGWESGKQYINYKCKWSLKTHWHTYMYLWQTEVFDFVVLITTALIHTNTCWKIGSSSSCLDPTTGKVTRSLPVVPYLNHHAPTSISFIKLNRRPVEIFKRCFGTGYLV